MWHFATLKYETPMGPREIQLQLQSRATNQIGGFFVRFRGFWNFNLHFPKNPVYDLLGIPTVPLRNVPLRNCFPKIKIAKR